MSLHYMGTFHGKKKKKPSFITQEIPAEDMKTSDVFIDVDGTVYTVKQIKHDEEHGITCVYATTTCDHKADGWFTRDSYDVIQAGE